MSDAVLTQLRAEVAAMTSYALGAGLIVPPKLAAAAAQVEMNIISDPDAVDAAVRVHEQLRAVVVPATPRTILLISKEWERARRFAWLPSLGPIRLIRQFTVLATLLIVVFIALALSPDVNRTSGDILDDSGLGLLLNLLFLLSAAGLGAVFSGMFRASRFVSLGTYDPRFEATYWINVVLGLIAGLLLAELVPEAFESDATQGGASFQLARPVLALVGGFSAAVVFRILQRLVDAVESIFKGDTRALVQAEIQQAQTLAAQQLAESRMALSTGLIKLEQQIVSGTDSPEAAAQVRAMLDELLPSSGFSLTAPPAEQTAASDDETPTGAQSSPVDATAEDGEPEPGTTLDTPEQAT